VSIDNRIADTPTKRKPVKKKGGRRRGEKKRDIPATIRVAPRGGQFFKGS